MAPDAMAALHRQCFKTPRPWSETEFASLLADPAVFVQSCADGFALGRVIVDEAELLTLAVASAKRRRGTGRALLAAYEQTARRRGAAESFLEVAADNDAARALYADAQYQQVGLRAGYFRGPDGAQCDAIVLRRAL